MSLPPGFLEELRNRVSLASIVGRKVTWERGKTNPSRGDFWAPCPFHQEKTASFHVKDREGFYYCFGCQAKGDAITFLRELEGMGFMEAVEVLAREAGMEIPAQDPRAAAKEKERRGLAEVMEACVQHYRLMLRGGKAQAAREYLSGRGLKDEAVARFELGFAPDERRGLAEAMAAKGIPEEDLVRAGMLIRPDDGGKPYDRFRGRIMFPIRDARGRCISFGGRAMSPEARAKYLNGPETELFDKGRSLYNHGPAREAAGKAGRLVLAEGYMDVIALAMAGFDEAAAPLGTAVTEDQLQLLWRMTDEPIVALDGDAAGLRAARRLATMALPLIAAGKSLRFCLMPEGRDPDDLIREGGAAAMEHVLSGALPLVEMLWRGMTEGRDLSSPERRAALDRELGAMLKKIGDRNLRQHYLDALRERRNALFRPQRAPWTPRRKGGRDFAAALQAAPTPETRRTLLAAGRGEVRVRECAILWGALHHPEVAERHEETLRDLPFDSPDLSDIRDAILRALPEALEAEDPSAALRAEVGRAAACNPAEILRSGPIRLIRALGPGSPPEDVAPAFAEALDRHAGFLATLDEGRAAVEDISLDTADEIAHRLAYISRERDESLRRGAGSELAASEEEAERSRWLRDFYDARPWEKKPRRRK